MKTVNASDMKFEGTRAKTYVPVLQDFTPKRACHPERSEGSLLSSQLHHGGRNKNRRRRRFIPVSPARLFLCVSLLLCLFASDVFAARIRVGTTFSRRQCQYLEIDPKKTYMETLNAGFDLIRLGAYWDEIEKKEGEWDFSMLDWELEQAKEKNVQVLLTVGMKAPRWPEYFIPDWVMSSVALHYGQNVASNRFLRVKTLNFVKEVVARYKDHEIITAWQVENEPLDRSGAKWWWIDSSFLAEETALVREIDEKDRPIVINAATFPNNFLRRLRTVFSPNHPLPESLAIADIWGLNIYPVVGHRFWRFNYYFWTHPMERGDYFRGIIELAKEHGKEVWITELQAEPWEPGHLAYRDQDRPPTGWPQMAADNFAELKQLGFQTVLLWGVEYWEHRRELYGDTMWWDVVNDILAWRSRPVPDRFQKLRV